MSILPRVDVSVRTPDLGLGGAKVDVGVGGGSGLDVDVAVGNLTAKVGLAGILASDSPVERLLHGPDALARFRTAPAADPSPIATKGMTLRAGDIYAEVATRHDIGGTKTPDAALRTDTAIRADAPGVTVRVAAGADTRAVPAVRNLADAAALPQRINGPGGTSASARGIDVGVGVPGVRAGASIGNPGLHLALGQSKGIASIVTLSVPSATVAAQGSVTAPASGATSRSVAASVGVTANAATETATVSAGTGAAERGAAPDLQTTPGVGGAARVGATPGVAAGASAAVASADGTRVLSLDGLVNIIDRAGTPLVSPQDAPAGAILVYERADGTQALELRTATGFAGLVTASAVPLTGEPGARSGEGYTLVGVLVPARGGPILASPFIVASAVAETAGKPVAVDEAASVRATAASAQASEARAAGDGSASAGSSEARTSRDGRTVTMQPGYANAIATSDLGGQVVRPADGLAIPAGLVVAQEDARPSFGEYSSDPATDRPYLHALWYDIMALRFAEAGVDLLGRSTVLRDVVWATAIEHGPFANGDATDVLSRVARALDLPAASDSAIIAALFAERTRIDDHALVHFPEVLPFDRERVVARLNDEAQVAVARLAPE